MSSTSSSSSSSCLLSLLLLLSLLVVPLLSLSPASLAVSSPPLAALPSVHVILIAGQSNAEGSNSDPILPEDAPNPRILQLTCCNGTRALPPAQCYLNVSSDPIQAPCVSAHGISFARPFARSLLATLPASDLIVLVQTAIGGTGFFDGTWTAYTGGGFKAAVARLQHAWTLLQGSEWAGYNVTFDVTLWHQGEDDAGDNFHAYNASTSVHLYQNVLPLIAALRNTSLLPFTRPSLPFVCGQLLPQWVNNASHPERAGVRDALALVTQVAYIHSHADHSTAPTSLPLTSCFVTCARVQYAAYTGFAESQGLLGDPLYRSGWDNAVIHFTGRSQRIFGRRYFAGYQAALVNYPEPPPAKQYSKTVGKKQ